MELTHEQQHDFDQLKAAYKSWLSKESGYDWTFLVLSNALEGTLESLGEDIPDWVKRTPVEAHMAAFALSAQESGLDVDFAELCEQFNISTSEWFKSTDPAPTAERRNAQFGCHLEEVAEMFPEITSGDEGLDAKMLLVKTLLDEIGKEFKEGRAHLFIKNRKKFFDSLLDQGVTGTGTAHLCGFQYREGMARVDWANFTKFVDEVVLYKDGGKVKKGPYFAEPDLTGKVGV